uniref:Bm9601 n=1 Tax=Brugia malayi TaxID=6279 RepID=A0A1I9G887_BRUMA|nr:Bm9601 [Brugia malayi]
MSGAVRWKKDAISDNLMLDDIDQSVHVINQATNASVLTDETVDYGR